MVQRASLGDTQGAVFLSLSEGLASGKAGELAQRSFGRPVLHRTTSDVHLATLQGRLSDSSEPDRTRQEQSSILKRRIVPRRPLIMIQSSSEPNLNIESRMPQEDDEQLTGLGTDGAQEASDSSRLESRSELSLEVPGSVRVDGTGDQQSLRRPSSVDDDRRGSEGALLVHFASSLNIKPKTEDEDKFLATNIMRFPRDTPTTHFRNPFQEGSTVDSRTPSDSSSDASSYIRPNAFSGHRDTLARIQRSFRDNNAEWEPISSSSSSLDSSILVHSSASRTHWDTFDHIESGQRTRPYVPSIIIKRLLQYLPFQDYLSLRLTCRQWCRALPEPCMPGSYRIPREVLQLVFSFLAPCDFDAARHSCRKWFDAGLDTQLLRSMLRSAQCQNAFKSDARNHRDALIPTNANLSGCSLRSYGGRPIPLATPATRVDPVTEEWLMSKRLATATRLSVDWRGSWSRRSISEGGSRFHVVEQVNFRRILIGLSSLATSTHEKTFTASTCGRYVLVSSGHDIFVYNLRYGEDTVTAMVRLSANSNVLRVSMDTSSGRYAVAALLSNRTGVLWDMNNGQEADQPRLHSGEPMSLGMRTEVRGSRVQDRTGTVTCHLPLRRGEVTSGLISEPYGSTMQHGAASDQAARHSLDLGAHSQVLEPSLEATFCTTPESGIDQLGPSTGIAIQTLPAATFRHLGSPNDDPRSVAICPSRKCVAFGCRLGIELHWVDALTGGDLNRWFPLAAPSDHLYFLPQRAGLDSSKKLRLISSAAGPAVPSTSRSESLPARLAVRAKTHDRGRRQSMTRLFFGSLPFPSAAVFSNGWRTDNVSSEEDHQGVLRTVDCDHYQAVPLSDGHHMLYTDPTNGLLCLGSDAPLGGPTKLIRKAVFGPPTVGDEGWAGLMSCYNAGQELRWGVRIVAAHRDGRLILYNVPTDVFNHIRHLRSAPDVWDEGVGVIAQSDVLMDDILSAHPNTLTDPIMGNAASRSDSLETPLRTVQIMGVEIGHVGRDTVDDVAVNTAYGGVRVWVFCRSGLAKLLDIYVDRDHQIRQRFIGSDGLPYETQAQANHREEDGCRSSKGKERAHDDDEGSPIWMRTTGFDGTSEELEEEPDTAEMPISLTATQEDQWHAVAGAGFLKKSTSRFFHQLRRPWRTASGHSKLRY